MQLVLLGSISFEGEPDLLCFEIRYHFEKVELQI